MTLITATLYSTLIATTSLSWANVYDELETSPLVRPQYKSFLLLREAKGPDVDSDFERAVRGIYPGSSYTISPVPRILRQAELDFLQRGVAQRGQALAQFRQELYSGGYSYEVGTRLTREKVKRLMSEADSLGYLPSTGVAARFMYAPDIIRDSEGRWIVLEDNASVVGGMSDAISAVELFHEFYSNLSSQFQRPKPDFFARLMHEYKKQAKGKAVLLLTSNCNDLEVNRMEMKFQSLGAFVDCPSLQSGWDYDFVSRQPKMTNRKTGEVKELGFVAIHSLFSFLDTSHPQAKRERLIAELKGHLSYPQLPEDIRQKMSSFVSSYEDGVAVSVQELEALANHNSFFSSFEGQDTFFTNFANPVFDSTRKFAGLIDSILQGRIASNITPGIQVLSHKELYPYVPELIRHYLGQEPILDSLRTFTFSQDPAEADTELSMLRSEPSKWVIKDQTGLGGFGVSVGKYESQEDWEAALLKVGVNTNAFQAQEYVQLSQMNDHIVDMRLHAQIMFGQPAIVSSSPYSRGSLAKAGKGKVNISQGGKQFAVLVENRKLNCVSELEK